MSEMNTPDFSLDADSLIKRMWFINHFIPCRVTHSGWLKRLLNNEAEIEHKLAETQNVYER